MSAKGRGPSLGGPEDYFTTPSWLVRRLLDVWSPPCPGYWVEPSAGNGAIIRAVNAVRQDVQWLACEVREDERDALAAIDYCRPAIANFLTEDPFGWARDEVSVVLGNPPYSRAEEFVHRARALFPCAEIVYILRLAFLASQDRAEMMRALPPDLDVSPDRPTFTGTGGGDSADYAWFHWFPGVERREFGRVRVLACTPLAERQQDRGHVVMIEPPQLGLFE